MTKQEIKEIKKEIREYELEILMIYHTIDDLEWDVEFIKGKLSIVQRKLEGTYDFAKIKKSKEKKEIGFDSHRDCNEGNYNDKL